MTKAKGNGSPNGLPLPPISERDLESWRGLALGKTTKEIAIDMGVTYSTACKFRDGLYPKIGCRSIADATRAAVRYGVITIDVMAAPGTIVPSSPRRPCRQPAHFPSAG